MLAFFVHGGNGGYAVALNRRQALFVAEYLKDLNASAAARRAGYSEKSAFRSGVQNMQKSAITDAIAAAMKERAERVQITADRVLIELGRLAFLDIRKAFNADGSLKPIHELDDDTAAAIAGIEVSETSGGDWSAGTLKKIKLSDKRASLELCGRHLQMFVDRVAMTIEQVPDEELDGRIAELARKAGTARASD